MFEKHVDIQQITRTWMRLEAPLVVENNLSYILKWNFTIQIRNL